MLHLFDKDNVAKVREYFLKNKQTIAVGESVTAGFLQLALSSAIDASDFFQGGITTYNLGQKYRHLLVDPIHADTCNCVSERVAQEMAMHVCQMFNSDWGIGITGYASPVPASHNKLFCYYAISFHGKIVIENSIKENGKYPLDVQQKYTNQVIEILAKYLTKLSEDAK